MDLISVLQTIASPKLRRDSRRYRRAVSASMLETHELPAAPAQRIRANEPKIRFGTDRRGREASAGITHIYGHGLILGASGAGKSYTATALMAQLAQARAAGYAGSFGLVDAKGETLGLVAGVLEKSGPVIYGDFAGASPVPYALLKARPGESVEGLVDRRMEVFDDVLGRDSQLSLRMSRMLRNFLLLAVENELAFPLLETLFSNPDTAIKLAGDSERERVRMYFEGDFAREKNTTLPALSARLDFILRHEQLRLSFGADEFIDFRTAMDEGTPILITAGGPSMPRSLTQIIQSIVVSDLRQAVFARQNQERPYLWFLDEAQVLFSQRADADNLQSLLAMSRSFGAYLALITQSLTAAFSDRELLASLETNVRWMTVFRCGMQDAKILEPALAVTGQVVRQRYGQGRVSYMTPAQELTHRLRQVTSLPPQTGYLWLRGSGVPARLVTMHALRLARWKAGAQAPAVSVQAIQKQLAEQEARLRRMAFRPAAGGRRAASSRRGNPRIHDILDRLEAKLGEAEGGAS